MSIDVNPGTTAGIHAERAPGTSCPMCGFDPHRLAVGDAVVALQSYPRRYRTLIQRALLDEQGEQHIRSRASSGDWSALEHVAHVRDVLHMLDKRIQRVVHEDRPVLPEVDLDTPPAAAHDQGAEHVLAGLATMVEQLARTAMGVLGDDWGRTGTFDSGSVSGLDLLREAVHEGTHHLRATERAIEAARS